jgi:hypothetical protein
MNYKDWDKDKIAKFFDVSVLLNQFTKMKNDEEENTTLNPNINVEKNSKIKKHLSRKRF